MNIHSSLFKVTVTEARLLSQFEVYPGINEAVGASDNFEYEVVAKLDNRVKAKLDAIDDDELEAALNDAKQAVLEEKDKELQTLQRRMNAAGGALKSAASNARWAAVDINRRGHGVRQAKRLGREYVPTQELAASQRIHQMHSQNESNGRLQIERMTSELGIRQSIRAHLASQPPPSRERVREIIGELKLNAEKLEAAKSKEVSLKLDKLDMNDDLRKKVDVLPVNIRAAIADSFTSEFPILMEKGLSNIVGNPVAFTALREAMDQGETAVNTGDADIDSMVNAFLASLTDEEEEGLKKFFDALDNQTAAALANPEAFGVTPEEQEAFIADRIALIKGILIQAKTMTDPFEESKLQGQLFIQKGLLMMSGVDIAVLEKGNWAGIDTQPVPMMKEDTPEAQMAKFGGLLLFAIGTAQFLGNSLKDLTNSKEKTPESFAGLDNEQLDKELKDAQAIKDTEKFKDKTLDEMKEAVKAEREALVGKVDKDRTDAEAVINTLVAEVAELEALEKKIKGLTDEKDKRTKEETDAETFLSKTVKVERSPDKKKWTLTFPKETYANPQGKEEGGVYEFGGNPRVILSGTTVTIGDATLALQGEDFLCSKPGTQEILYRIKYLDEAAYNAARTKTEPDKEAFMRSSLDVRNNPNVYMSEISMDPSRLPYSPSACAQFGTVAMTLAASAAAEVPSFVPATIKDDPTFITALKDTKDRLNKYQAMLAQLKDLTGGKLHVRMWSDSGDWEPELSNLKAKINTLASNSNAVAWLKEGKNYSALTDKTLAIPIFKDYIRSDEVMTIRRASITALERAIDVIIAAHP